MPNVIQEKNVADVVYVHINRRTKKGRYVILPDYSQHKYCEKVLLEGFDRLPSGFYTKDGIGLTGAGNFILQEISDKYGGKKIELTLTASGKPRLCRAAGTKGLA